jgi:hypothetical protein
MLLLNRERCDVERYYSLRMVFTLPVMPEDFNRASIVVKLDSRLRGNDDQEWADYYGILNNRTGSE